MNHPEPGRRRPRDFWPWLLLLLLVVLGLLGLSWYLARGDDGSSAESGPVAPSTTRVVPTATVPTMTRGVTVRTGPKESEVPDVVGLAAADATTRLVRAGFRSRLRSVEARERQGTVVAQAPRGGVAMERGRIVVVDVSEGPSRTTTTVTTTTAPAASVAIPNTVGQDQAAATTALDRTGFRVSVVDETVADPAQDGLVLRQAPRAGVKARAGTTVTITVGHLR